jgi:O-acetyl-ADP-ribose deacetylase (regulator of RNase III)
MGKGLALQFKRRYPDVFRAYEQACRNGEVRTGQMHVVVTNELHGPRYVINFPTKQHWRSPSRLEYIDQGLADLVRKIRELGVTSIAVPPLGAGNGGLHWPDVAALIERHLGTLPDIDIRLFAPTAGSRPIKGRQDIRMTWGRAVLIDLLQSYVLRRAAAEPWEDSTGASHLEIQKLMYFANEVEPGLKLSFSPGRYGPYSEKVRHLVQEMEGSLLTGHGDGSAAALSLEPIAPTDRARAELTSYQAGERGPAERAIVRQVLDQVAGFEGAYGLELLASTHWVVAHDRATDDAAERVRGWTERKGRIFTDAHISIACDHLRRVGALRPAT